MSILGLDLGHRTASAAEHWLAALPRPPGLIACTHLVHGSRPRVVITLAAPGPIDIATLPLRPDHAGAPEDDRVALTAAADHAGRRSGRAVIYPGVDMLTGVLTVADLLANSAIEGIRMLGAPGVEAGPDTLVDTRDFVRPQWMDGRLTLVATPAPAGRIAPFEVPNPTPCCGGDH